jgi:hypothetical protein
MVDPHASPKTRLKEQLVEFKCAAIAALEQRGYEVRGKTTSQIRQILRARPTKPQLAGKSNEGG